MEDNRNSQDFNNEQNNQNVNQYQPQNQMNNQQGQEPQNNNQQQSGQPYYDQQQPNYQSQNNQQQYNYSGQPLYQQSFDMQQEPKNSNGMAIGSLVCGILCVLVNCCAAWFLSLPTAIAGLVLGIISLKNKKAGKAMAIVGIVLSSIGAFFGLITLIGCAVLSSNRSLLDQIMRELEFELDGFYY